MDLGIAGKKAIVGGASEGLGRAIATSLAKEGVNLTIVARTREKIEAAAAEIRAATGVSVTPLALDIFTDEGRKEILKVCPEPDIVINNAGGPPTGNFRDFDRKIWLDALNNNMVAPILMIKDVVDGMIARKFGRIINITSSAVKAPINVLALSNGARSGLTGFIAGLARDPNLSKNNVTINNVLPGDFDTERHRSNTRAMAKAQNKSYEEVHKFRLSLIPAGRFGDPSELGDFCTYLCSQQAGFVNAQNLLLDAGKFPGTF
jgi:3-oxoacyl-[acyl-carrier protein] reductase